LRQQNDTTRCTDFPENELLGAIQTCPQLNDIVSGFTGWHFAIVDLREVLVFQLIVRIDDMETRGFFFQECQEQIYEICFPTERPIKFAQIQDARGYTISSLNPNFGISTVPLNPGQSIMLSVATHPSSPPVPLPALEASEASEASNLYV
jgi:hypothetical protein